MHATLYITMSAVGLLVGSLVGPLVGRSVGWSVSNAFVLGLKSNNEAILNIIKVV